MTFDNRRSQEQSLNASRSSLGWRLLARAELHRDAQVALFFGLAGNFIDVLLRGVASAVGTLFVVLAASVLVTIGAPR